MVIVPFGEAGWRVEVPVAVDRAAFQAALRRVPGVREAVLSELHAVVTFDPDRPPEALPEALTRLEAVPRCEGTPATHVIRVRYDGDDLTHVAEHTGGSVAEVIRLHSECTYSVRVVGFLPGFAYLAEVSPRIAVPRRASPRVRVPRLSVGIAGGRTGIYPCASPGGWNLLGTAVDFTPFHPRRGAVLALGDRVEFVPS